MMSSLIYISAFTKPFTASDEEYDEAYEATRVWNAMLAQAQKRPLTDKGQFFELKDPLGNLRLDDTEFAFYTAMHELTRIQTRVRSVENLNTLFPELVKVVDQHEKTIRNLLPILQRSLNLPE